MPHNFYALLPLMNNVSLTRDDQIYWNGKSISADQLSRNLELAHQMNPQPDVFLEAEMGASCRVLEDVRNRMERALECNKPNPRCAEGIKDVWRELPSPQNGPVL